MSNIAKRMLKISASPTLDITSLAKNLIKEGKDVVSFGAGEPDFGTPEPIKNAAKKAIDLEFTKYTPASGTVELKEAIASKFLKDNGLRYNTPQIIVSCGAKHAIYNIFQVLLDEGDETILTFPYWVSYPEMIKLAGGKPVPVNTKESNGFKLKLKELKKGITKRTKVIVLNSPSNPAGVVYNKKELEEIADIAVSKKIYVISDEIYEKLIFDGEEHVSIGSLGNDIYNRTLTVNGVSKTYSMTGWRIGYLGASEKIAKAISVLQSHSTSNPASISQKAALEALSLGKEVIEKMRLEFQGRRDYMMGLLDEIPDIGYVRPSGAFYIFCNISKTGLKAKDFAKKLLDEKLVAVIPGEAFGSDKYIRLSFATSRDNIKKGLDRVKEWLKQ